MKNKWSLKLDFEKMAINIPNDFNTFFDRIRNIKCQC